MNLSKMRLVQLGGVVVFVIAVALLVASFSAQVKVTVAPSDANADGGYGPNTDYSTVNNPAKNQGPKLGSASSPPVNGDCMEVNGVNHCYYSTAFNQASSTCQFKTPAASSTIEIATATLTNGRGTVLYGEWGKSRDVNSTTTSLGFGSIGATAQYGTIAASTTAAGQATVNPPYVLNANSYLTFKVGSTSPTYVGKCVAELIY